MKPLFTPLLLILFISTSMAQEPVIPCSVKDGKTDTTLKCLENGKVIRLVFPRNQLRFPDCKTVNLQRGRDGKLIFAPEQSCHIIDSGAMIAACEEWQESQRSQAGYDLARNPNSLYLPDCEHWWTNVEGEQALVPVHLMSPLPKTDSALKNEGWNAYLDGATLKQNPYSEDPDLRLRRNWRAGWIHAQGRFEKRRK